MNIIPSAQKVKQCKCQEPKERTYFHLIRCKYLFLFKIYVSGESILRKSNTENMPSQEPSVMISDRDPFAILIFRNPRMSIPVRVTACQASKIIVSGERVLYLTQLYNSDRVFEFIHMARQTDSRNRKFSRRWMSLITLPKRVR